MPQEKISEIEVSEAQELVSSSGGGGGTGTGSSPLVVAAQVPMLITDPFSGYILILATPATQGIYRLTIVGNGQVSIAAPAQMYTELFWNDGTNYIQQPLPNNIPFSNTPQNDPTPPWPGSPPNSPAYHGLSFVNFSCESIRNFIAKGDGTPSKGIWIELIASGSPGSIWNMGWILEKLA